jgi:diguanylate cyclase (GGDEF)-like protein
LNSSWTWQAATLGKTDRDYKEAYLREDKTQARIIIAIIAAWAFAYCYIEYLDLGITPGFYLLFALRFLFLCASSYLFLKIRKLNNPETVELAILVWSITGVLLVISSNLIVNNTTIKNININLAWVLGLHLILPTRHLYRLIPALLISIFSIYILLGSEGISLQAITLPVLMAKAGSMLMINIVGFVSALRLDAQRYHQYLIQKTLIDGNAQLKELAASDSLTGIFNRRSFFEAANTEFDRYQRYGESLSFAILDIDKLKNINDRYGHPAGDQAILFLTDTIGMEKRSSDTVGRLAGDEFGLLLPNTGADQALEVLSRIKKVLEGKVVQSTNGQPFQVRFSAGIAEPEKTDKNLDDVYLRADKALLVAKQSGGNHLEQA